MPTSRRLTMLCDSFILKALEAETSAINRLNNQAGFRRLRTNEIAIEVLKNWAIEKLAPHGTKGPQAPFEESPIAT